MVSEPVLARTLLTDTYAVQSVGPPEKKWMDFFDNPNAYWDNRQNKRNPKAPDFKHKDDKDTVLWLDSRDTPNCELL